MNTVELEVPASAANLGPGFDCLAMALSLTNRFTFRLVDKGLDVRYRGLSADSFPLDDTNLAVAAFMELAEEALGSRPGLQLQAEIQVPPASGFGSSSTAVIAGLLAANHLLKLEYSHSELLTKAAIIEGHADNAAAALLGGLVVVRRENGAWQAQSLPLAQQRLVAVVPHLNITTEQMRAILPAAIERDQAVANTANLLFMVRSLASADFNMLRSTSQVSFHQQARLAHIPGAEAALEAGRAAGGAVMLAGAGPALIALAPDHHQSIAAAIKDAFEAADVESSIYYLETRHQGAVILPAA